jgi:hypothetical protein
MEGHDMPACVFCQEIPAEPDSPSGLCRPCALEQAIDRATEARKTIALAEQARQARWFAHLARLPEIIGNLFREEDQS